MDKFFSSVGEFFSSGWDNIGAWAIDVLPTLLKCIAVLVFGYWFAGVLAGLLRRAMRRSKAGEELAIFAGSGLRFVLRMLAFLWALSLLNINIVSVLTALSAVGITLGLALKDTITSFTSGFIIMGSKPFKKGDLVEIGGNLGIVDKIEMMNTTLLTTDNKTLVIPNCTITAATVINYTENPNRRINLRFRVAPDSDLELVKKVLVETAEKCPVRLSDRAITVGVTDFSSTAVELEVRVWIEANGYTAAGFDIRERMIAAFAENGIKAV